MLMISILTLLGCTTQKNYTFKKMKIKGEDVTVSGQVKDFNTKEALEAIMVFDSKNTYVTQTDKAGKYKIILKKGKYQFVSGTIGYYPNRTKIFRLKPGNSIQIIFLIKEDNRGTIN
jgi:hypothetical protein